jgi:hypothetical protein
MYTYTHIHTHVYIHIHPHIYIHTDACTYNIHVVVQCQNQIGMMIWNNIYWPAYFVMVRLLSWIVGCFLCKTRGCMPFRRKREFMADLAASDLQDNQSWGNQQEPSIRLDVRLVINCNVSRLLRLAHCGTRTDLICFVNWLAVTFQHIQTPCLLLRLRTIARVVIFACSSKQVPLTCYRTPGSVSFCGDGS